MVTPSTTTSFSLPLGPDSRWALFIDLDGTLLDDCPKPERVVATQDVIRLLPALQRTFNGAVALLSGRPIRDIDRILFPLQLPCAGLHGAERRSSDGNVSHLSVDSDVLSAVRSAAAGVGGRRGVAFEDKHLGFAVHTRATPSAFEETEVSIAAIAERSQGVFRLLRGHNVIELVPHAASTGHAVVAFLDEPAFAGRRPLVFGDDAADADAFRAAIERKGVSIAVGDHAPNSEHWVPSPRECRRLLAELVNLGDLGLVG
jgi:trehalose 6-phosphate phosphatase